MSNSVPGTPRILYPATPTSSRPPSQIRSSSSSSSSSSSFSSEGFVVTYLGSFTVQVNPNPELNRENVLRLRRGPYRAPAEGVQVQFDITREILRSAWFARFPRHVRVLVVRFLS